MNQLQTLYSTADQFRNRRARLAAKVADVDAWYREEMAKLQSDHTSRLQNLDAECQSAIAACESRTKKEIAGYVEKERSLQIFQASVHELCPTGSVQQYHPRPEQVCEIELNELVRMLQEQGVVAWLKRTLGWGGYRSKAKMALELSHKIEDSCAYCLAKIESVETKYDQEKAKYLTAARRKMDSENKAFRIACQELEQRKQKKKEGVLATVSAFDTARELRELHTSIEKMRLDSDNACGKWGEYRIPAKMPEQVLLCHVGLTLPDQNGIDKNLDIPLWLDLFRSQLIVVTSKYSDASGPNSMEKQFVCKLLARMLKTIPPEHCSYSVFDDLYKGASLARLIDISNEGSTNLNFDLFTSNDAANDSVTCAERRQYLQSFPVKINKFIAGKSRSLFEYNKTYGKFEFPFNWLIDFHFPGKPDSRMESAFKELFANASIAGYSFILVTTPEGYENIRRLLQGCKSTSSLIHVDFGSMTCQQGDFTVPFRKNDSPSADQIDNFMTALKRFYDAGGAVDNRIGPVFSRFPIGMRDASKILSIPMALDSRGRLVDLNLGGDGSAHGFISGASNSGKSTLLHSIILSACLHYSPQDLEIWLVDYKQTEFYLYKKNCPPHIKLIGISKTAEFTFSLLDKLDDEGMRRTELLKQFRARDLAEYRKHAGEVGYVNLTRLFVVIDEFHEMSQFAEQEDDYKRKLENILREYRAQGITVLMADQSFSNGLGGLTVVAKNQTGLRIAMRNEVAPQEIKETLAVDRALYSDSMERTLRVMNQGDFIMKVIIPDAEGKQMDTQLEKCKALLTTGKDVLSAGKALQNLYHDLYDPNDLLYVNTTVQTPWRYDELQAIDSQEPLRYPYIRLYLGHSATLQPCFALDIGRQPNENLSVVGGTAYQRWELLSAVMRSCRYRDYKLLVFMAEYSDLMCDFAEEIRNLCSTVPNAELVETTEQWCAKLDMLEDIIDQHKKAEDIVCVFIGLELANIEFNRLPSKGEPSAAAAYQSSVYQYCQPVGDLTQSREMPASIAEFNAMPIIEKLFSFGSRSGLRCVTEVSVYRQFDSILHIKDMCRHKIAFSMSADDCMMYLGNSNFQKHIGQHAIYSNGGADVKKLFPYKIQTTYQEGEL